MEIPECYREIAKRLNVAGVKTHINGDNAFQLVCSSGRFSGGPYSSNSFWIVKKDENPWYLVTWSPHFYKVPNECDIVEVCRCVVECSKTTIYVVPEDIMRKYGLTEVGEDEELPPDIDDEEDPPGI